MSPDVRREALAALDEVWSLSPEVRLGQLMAHLGFLGQVHLGHGLGDLDDDELVSILYRHRQELLSHCADASKASGSTAAGMTGTS